jgi:NAD(P)-dependent dehydrogenase (short-subunit alcohol dehydrogenase family)
VVITARTVEPGTGRFTENAAAEAKPHPDRRIAEGSRRADRGRWRQGGPDPMRCGDPASRAKAVDQALAAVGHIDILVNNAAGGGYGQSWDQISSAHFDRLIETNLKGPLDFMQRWRRA